MRDTTYKLQKRNEKQETQKGQEIRDSRQETKKSRDE